MEPPPIARSQPLRTEQDAGATDPLASTYYSSALISVPAKVLPAAGNVLAAQDITDMVGSSADPAPAAGAAAFPLKIVRSYEKSADGAALVMRFNLTVTDTKAVKIVGLGFAMPESPGSPPRGIQETVRAPPWTPNQLPAWCFV